MAGFLPFSAIYIELYYIFASVWGHKVNKQTILLPFYKSSCASNGKGAHTTPPGPVPFSHPASSSPLSPTSLPLGPGKQTNRSYVLGQSAAPLQDDYPTSVIRSL
eukprot:108075-Pyramimonas_sp.AAC.1